MNLAANTLSLIHIYLADLIVEIAIDLHIVSGLELIRAEYDHVERAHADTTDRVALDRLEHLFAKLREFISKHRGRSRTMKQLRHIDLGRSVDIEPVGGDAIAQSLRRERLIPIVQLSLIHI